MIQYIKGELFAVASNPSVLLHSCNCRGSWGGGVAAAFAIKFPSGLIKHQDYCKRYKQNPAQLLGLSQVISTSRDDKGNKSISGAPAVATRFIVCLFTSVNGGMDADSPDSILINTEKALQNLETKLFCDELDIPKYVQDQVEQEAVKHLRATFRLQKNEALLAKYKSNNLEILPKTVQSNPKLEIMMPMINSGIFRVPWEDTEYILENHQPAFNFKVIHF